MQWQFIDSHVHLLADYDSAALDRIAESGKLKQAWVLPINCYSSKFNFAGEDQVLEIGKRYPGLFIPFGFIDFQKGADQVDRIRDAGFSALKAIRPTSSYDDERYFPIYERAEALDLPILFHVGIISQKTRAELSDPHMATGPVRMRPSHLDTIGAAFPELRLIQGHMGVPWCNELFESIWYYSNIRCSVSGLIDYEWLIRNLDRKTATGEPYYKRFMFATDTQYGSSECWKFVQKRAEFMHDFFDYVGDTYCWSKGRDDYMLHNAEQYGF